MDIKKSIMDIGKPLRYKKISVKSNFPDYDLSEINGAQYFTVISEKLKRRLDSENVVGLEYLELNSLEKFP